MRLNGVFCLLFRAPKSFLYSGGSSIDPRTMSYSIRVNPKPETVKAYMGALSGLQASTGFDEGVIRFCRTLLACCKGLTV